MEHFYTRCVVDVVQSQFDTRQFGTVDNLTPQALDNLTPANFTPWTIDTMDTMDKLTP